MSDRLSEIFNRRESFMLRLRELMPESSPDWPVDLSAKENQQHVRDMALRGVEEMFEALQHLKNWKPHRQTEITEFDRGEFLEEIVDAFNYFLSILVLTGFSADDLMEAYRKKDEIINSRLETGY
jgi:predicted house-cleaning noncanonical NTP pyrophosphatase (MazG superfamily)